MIRFGGGIGIGIGIEVKQRMARKRKRDALMERREVVELAMWGLGSGSISSGLDFFSTVHLGHTSSTSYTSD
jgi:hypothetical protein